MVVRFDTDQPAGRPVREHEEHRGVARSAARQDSRVTQRPHRAIASGQPTAVATHIGSGGFLRRPSGFLLGADFGAGALPNEPALEPLDYRTSQNN